VRPCISSFLLSGVILWRAFFVETFDIFRLQSIIEKETGATCQACGLFCLFIITVPCPSLTSFYAHFAALQLVSGMMLRYACLVYTATQPVGRLLFSSRHRPQSLVKALSSIMSLWSGR
jgi:hypothetical protein